jgi:hypothetical protein
MGLVQAPVMLSDDRQLELGLLAVGRDAAGDDDPLGGRHRATSTVTGDGPGGLRFAFYGRMSTREFQDQASSRSWQRD